MNFDPIPLSFEEYRVLRSWAMLTCLTKMIAGEDIEQQKVVVEDLTITATLYLNNLEVNLKDLARELIKREKQEYRESMEIVNSHQGQAEYREKIDRFIASVQSSDRGSGQPQALPTCSDHMRGKPAHGRCAFQGRERLTP